MQKIMIISGVVLILTGLAWPWLSKLPLGRLPGDIAIESENVKFYFPVVTSIIFSLLLTLILYFFRK
ncbi:MAG: DUF2905 domain-containing protein [Leptospiraceae bacterium]|nr:DUF2905 domain-containing protein [Leptospiraceae bacterium]